MRILATLIVLLVVACGPVGNQSPAVSIRVQQEVVNPGFGGVGFHVFYHVHNAPRWHYEQVFAKRWRELNPSFVRINDDPRWDEAKLDTVAQYLEVMKETGTEIYLTSWGTNAIHEYKDPNQYVAREIDHLEYLKRSKGFDKLKYYCMANELSLDGWASMVKDLEYFKKIQGLFFDEITKRDLDIKLLATDASPFSNWPTIEWASNNMDAITGVYGGHHYINSYDLFDSSFYSFFYNKTKWGADLAKSKGKRFIVGEFGAKQNSNNIDGIRHDAMIYNNTPLEKYMGIQVAEAIIAMINAGVYGCNYWTFSDFPSNYRDNYINKWGLFRWEVDNYTTKPNYYCLGLLTKFLRGPADAHAVESADSLLRIAAVTKADGGMTIAVVNRRNEARSIRIDMSGLSAAKPFRRYMYNPADVPFNYFGDLQSYDKLITSEDGVLKDAVPAMSLVVYTTCYDDDRPGPVTNLTVENKELEGRMRNVLSWTPNPEKDFCYYRIYRSEKPDVEVADYRQIASTISNTYIDKAVHNMPAYYYKVIAVDQSGNSGDPGEKGITR